MTPTIDKTLSDVEAGTAPLYQLFHRQGSHPGTLIKYFHHRGEFRSVIQRAQKHCELTNLRFIKVTPFLSDLDAEEKLHNQ